MRLCRMFCWTWPLCVLCQHEARMTCDLSCQWLPTTTSTLSSREEAREIEIAFRSRTKEDLFAILLSEASLERFKASHVLSFLFVCLSGKAVVSVVLESNSEFAKAVENLALPRQELFRIPSGKLSLPAMRLVPENVPSTTSLPTLFYAYNGPLVQTVTARHFMLQSGTIGKWHAYLASQHGIQVCFPCLLAFDAQQN